MRSAHTPPIPIRATEAVVPTINSPAYAYDLQEINEEVLRDTKERVHYNLLKQEDKKRTAEAAEALVSTDLTFASLSIADEYLHIFYPFTYITPLSYTLQMLLGCMPTFASMLILVAALPLCTKITCNDGCVAFASRSIHSGVLL